MLLERWRATGMVGDRVCNGGAVFVVDEIRQSCFRREAYVGPREDAQKVFANGSTGEENAEAPQENGRSIAWG